MTMEYRRARGISASIVRIFDTYGPRMSIDDGRAVPEFIAAALAGRPLPVFGDGAQSRAFCFVSDLVDALLLVALDPSADGEVFNAGSPDEITVLELARQVSAACGRSRAIDHLAADADGAARRWPDITRMRERYGWQPRVALDEGLRQTVDYFRSWLDERTQAAA
jgi:nucleoside-diphosphate-sugar epimerase